MDESKAPFTEFTLVVASGDAVLEMAPGFREAIRKGDTITFAVTHDGGVNVTQVPEHVPHVDTNRYS